MARKYKRKYTNTRKGNSYKPYTNYTEENLQIALQAVKNQTLSIGDAAKTYDVPKTTLWRKLNNKNCSQEKAGRPTLFSATEERCFIEHIKILSEWGFPFDLTDLRVFAQKYLQKIGKVVYGLQDNMPGADWARYFLERHKKELSNRLASNISTDRAKTTPEIIDEFFENYAKTVEGVSPDRIINYDETNLTDDPGNKKYIYKRGTKYPERVVNSSKTAISLMFSGTAEGQLLPIYVVYKSDHLWDTWMEGGPEHTRYNRSKSGWFDGVCFEDWFFKVIVPYAKSKPGRKVIVGDNLSSHFSASVLKTCEELNIAFVCLPPKTTHLLQPLDVAFYAPLKNYWREILTKWKKLEGRKHKTLIKSSFPRLLSKLKNKLTEKNAESNNLIAGFNKSGLFPINPLRPKSRLPQRSEVCPEEEIYKATTDVITDMLQEMRGSVSGEAPKRKKRVNVPPGKSVTFEDIMQTPVSKKIKPKKNNSKKQVSKSLVDYSLSNSEDENDSDVTFVPSDVSDNRVPCVLPGPSGLSNNKVKKKEVVKNKQPLKSRKIKTKENKTCGKGKGTGKKSNVGKENRSGNKLNPNKTTRRKNSAKKRFLSSSGESTSVSDHMSVHSDSDIIDIPEDINDSSENLNIDDIYENMSFFSAARMKKYNMYDDDSSIEDLSDNIRTINPLCNTEMTSKETNKRSDIDKDILHDNEVQVEVQEFDSLNTTISPSEFDPEVRNPDTNDTRINETGYNLKTDSSISDRLEVTLTTENEKTGIPLAEGMDSREEVHDLTNVENENQHEEQLYLIDNYVLVRYFQRNKWVYYIGIIDTVAKKYNTYYYSITFLKTIKKPELKFITTKKIDHDEVPQISIVKKVELKLNKKNPKEFLLYEDDDKVYFM